MQASPQVTPLLCRCDIVVTFVTLRGRVRAVRRGNKGAPAIEAEAPEVLQAGQDDRYLTVTRVLVLVAEKYEPSTGEYQRQ